MTYKGFRDRAAHDRAHELMRLSSWHPDAPSGPMRHMLRLALKRCLTTQGFCDYEARSVAGAEGPDAES